MPFEIPENSEQAQHRKRWSRKLDFKITVLVFLSIVVIEAAILFPSYMNYKRDLLVKAEQVGRAHFISSLRAMSHHTSNADLLMHGTNAVAAGEIKGGTLYDLKGRNVGSFGDPPKASLSATLATMPHPNVSEDGLDLDVVWPADITKRNVTVIARLDIGWVQIELRNFILRVAGLVLLISAFVCSATMFILNRLILRRIRALEQWLSTVSVDSDFTNNNPPAITEDDELAAMSLTLYRLVERSHEIYSEIHNARAVLADVNAELELRVRKRTAALRTEMEERQRSEAEYRSIFENAAQGIVRTTPDGQFVKLNAAYAGMLGYASPEDMKSHVTDIGTQIWVDKEERRAMLDSLRQDGKTQMEVQMRCKNGDSAWVHMSVWKGQSEDGGRGYIEAILQDISERKQAEQTLQNAYDTLEQRVAERTTELQQTEGKLREILGNSPVGIAVVTNDEAGIPLTGNRLLVNPALAQMFGASSTNELIDANILDSWVDPEDLKVVETIMKGGDLVDVEARRRRMDGTEWWAMLNSRSIQFEDRDCTMIWHYDITERRQQEQHLQSAMDELVRATQAKSDFMASMSHELRTPLNAIMGFAEMIANQYLGPIENQRYTNYGRLIMRSGAHLLEMVNDILDIERIAAGKYVLTIQEVSIGEVIYECCTFVGHRADEGGINLDISVPKNLPTCPADRRALLQLLINLMTNAIKFTPEDGKVLLSAKTNDTQHIIEVRDTGIGIPEDKLPTITDPFTRHGIDPTIAQDGVGLGLSICNSLVDLHGGRLTIESEVGKGTTVTVRLPRTHARAS